MLPFNPFLEVVDCSNSHIFVLIAVTPSPEVFFFFDKDILLKTCGRLQHGKIQRKNHNRGITNLNSTTNKARILKGIYFIS